MTHTTPKKSNNSGRTPKICDSDRRKGHKGQFLMSKCYEDVLKSVS